jgi:biotin carboxylase
MSKHLLLLSRNDPRRFLDLNGQSVLANLPFTVTLFTQLQNIEFWETNNAGVNIQAVKRWDAASVMCAAIELHQKIQVDSVLTLDEQLMSLAALVREAIGVRGLDRTLTARFRDKSLMKTLLFSADIRVPDFVVCNDRQAVRELMRCHGRIVLKPIDGQGSVGVAILSTSSEIDCWWDSCPDVERYEAEAFIDGTFFHTNSFVDKGRVIRTICGEYAAGRGDINFTSGAPLATRVLPISPLSDMLERFSERVITVLELETGTTHLECFVTPRGEIVFCEIAARPGGGVIPSLIEAHTGVHPYRAAMLLEVGERVSFSTDREDGVTAAAIGFRAGSKVGLVDRVSFSSELPHSWVRNIQVFKIPCELVSGAAFSTDFLGQAVFWSESTEQFEERCDLLEREFDLLLSLKPL